MQSFPTVLLIHTLHAILDHVEQPPDACPNPSQLVEFTRELHQQIARLEQPWHPPSQEAA